MRSARMAEIAEFLDGGEPDDPLVAEGLELISAYLSISDQATRLALKHIVVSMAMSRASSVEAASSGATHETSAS